MSDVYVRGQPLDALVWNVLKLDGHLAPAMASVGLLDRADGPQFFGSRVSVSARSMTIGLDVRPATLAERTTTLDTLARLFTGVLPVQTVDDLTRVTYYVCQSAPTVQFYDAIHGNPVCYVEYTLTAADPYRYSVEPTALALTSTRVACPVGHAAVAPRIWLYGAATAVVDPEIIVRNASGDEVSRLSLVVSLGTNDAIEIDCAAQTVDRYASGVLQTGSSAGLGTVASGDFPLLDPRDGVPASGQYPSLALSSTTGTPTGVAIYWRRW